VRSPTPFQRRQRPAPTIPARRREERSRRSRILHRAPLRRICLRMPIALSLAAAGQYPKAQDGRGTTHPMVVRLAVRDWWGVDPRTDRQQGFAIALAIFSPFLKLILPPDRSPSIHRSWLFLPARALTQHEKGAVSNCVQQPARSAVFQRTRRRITLKVATAISQQAPEEEAQAASASVFLFVGPFQILRCARHHSREIFRRETAPTQMAPFQPCLQRSGRLKAFCNQRASVTKR